MRVLNFPEFSVFIIVAPRQSQHSLTVHDPQLCRELHNSALTLPKLPFPMARRISK